MKIRLGSLQVYVVIDHVLVILLRIRIMEAHHPGLQRFVLIVFRGKFKGNFGPMIFFLGDESGFGLSR
jgi:hypothetical protein